jgi:transposase
VQRAQLIWARVQGESGPAMAHHVGLSAFRVRAWLHRFNRHGLAGVVDAPRSGRPRPHEATARGTGSALARTKPRRLGYPFALWPRARLPQARQARHRLQVTPATIWPWRHAEGLVWKRQQRWFQGQEDAAIVEHRGPSSRPTPRRSRRGGSSAAPSWAP